MFIDIFRSPPGMFMGELLLKGAAVVLLAMLAVRIGRHASASYRHAIWAAALLVLAALPVAMVVAPELRLPVPHLGGQADIAEVSQSMSAALVLSSDEAGSFDQDHGEASPATPSPDDSSVLASNLRMTMLAIWALGALLLILVSARARIRVAMITRFGSTPAEGREQDFVADYASAIGLSRPPQVRVTHWTAIPVTWGIVRPVLLLPPAVEFWSAARMRVVVQHELAHIKRRDYAWQLVADLAIAFHWPNPMAWWARNGMHREQERACDDSVLQGGTTSAEYAEHLVEIARSSSPERATTTTHSTRESALGIRVRDILDTSFSRRPLARFPAAAGVVVTLLVGFAVAGATFAPPPSTPRSVAELWALTGNRSPQAQDVLLAQLVDPDPERRGLAALSLGERRDATAVPPLIATLADPDPYVREMATVALVEFGGADAVRGVAALTSDPITSVRAVATWALGQLGGTEGLEALLGLIDVEPDEHARMMAVMAVTAIADVEFLPDLVARLETQDESLRNDLAAALGLSGDPRAVPALAELATKDQSETVRITAIRALGEIDDPRRVDAWLRAMSDAEWRVRNQSLLQLVSVEESRAQEAVIKALRDPQHQVRLNAAWAMDQVGR